MVGRGRFEQPSDERKRGKNSSRYLPPHIGPTRIALGHPDDRDEPLLQAAAYIRGDHVDGHGAGNGNRTRIARVEIWCSTTELYRQVVPPGEWKPRRL